MQASRVLALGFAVLIGCVGIFHGPSADQFNQKTIHVIDKYEEGGGPREIELLAAATVYGLVIPEHSRVGFQQRGEMAWIKNAEPMQVSGIAFPAGSKISVVEHQHDFSSRTVGLDSVQLGSDATFGAVALAAGDVVAFDDEKLPAVASLSGDRTFADRTYARGSRLFFNKAGEVAKALSPAALRQLERADTACRERCAPLAGDDNALCIQRCIGT